VAQQQLAREREEEAAMASTTSAASLVRLWAPPKTFSPSAASSSPSTSYSPSLSGSNSAFFASEMFLRLRCSQAIAQQQQQREQQQQQKQRQRRQTGPVSIRAETTKAKGLSVEQGGKWLSSTTRHVRIFAGYIDPVTDVMDQSQLDKLTLMLDPDDEFLWPEDKVQAVYAYFKELVDHYAGAPLTEYTLRLIGSDIEHYIRKMLLAGEIKYNLDCRVLNFSMGKPRIDPRDVEDLEEEDEG
jgi:hypothetical protein